MRVCERAKECVCVCDISTTRIHFIPIVSPVMSYCKLDYVSYSICEINYRGISD